MKSSLQWIFLTALLCGGTFYLGYQFGNTKASAAKPLPITVTQSQDTAPPSTGSQDNFHPFQWSQIESTDYRTYIANLRGIGCPEQTIRDIITTDVDSVFVQRRDKLTESTAGESLKATLAALREQEDQFLISLLGPSSDKNAVIAAAPQPARSLRAKNPDSIPSMPLVLQNIDLSSLKLNASQLQTVDELRQRFRQQIGSAQNPNDPAYRERWLKAQHECDDLLRGMLGSQTYMDYATLATQQRPQGQAQ